MKATSTQNPLLSASPQSFLTSAAVSFTSSPRLLPLALSVRGKLCLESDSRKLGPGGHHHRTHDAQTSLSGLDAKLHELSSEKVWRRSEFARHHLPRCPGARLSAEHKSSRTFSYNPSSPRGALLRACFARVSANYHDA